MRNASRRWVTAALTGAPVAAVVLVAGCGSASSTAGATSADGSGSPAADSVLVGTFLAIGGPYPGIKEELSGTVVATRMDGFVVRVTVQNGRYTVNAPAGRYTLQGFSPRIGGGTAGCPGSEPVDLDPTMTTRADVICNLA